MSTFNFIIIKPLSRARRAYDSSVLHCVNTRSRENQLSNYQIVLCIERVCASVIVCVWERERVRVMR